MAQRRTLRTEVDELRSELAALRKARGDEEEIARQKDSKETKVKEKPVSSKDRKDQPFELEQTFKELVESSEKEIAENPLIAAGLAFMLGFIVGRMSRT